MTCWSSFAFGISCSWDTGQSKFRGKARSSKWGFSKDSSEAAARWNSHQCFCSEDNTLLLTQLLPQKLRTCAAAACSGQSPLMNHPAPGSLPWRGWKTDPIQRDLGVHCNVITLFTTLRTPAIQEVLAEHLLIVGSCQPLFGNIRSVLRLSSWDASETAHCYVLRLMGLERRKSISQWKLKALLNIQQVLAHINIPGQSSWEPGAILPPWLPFFIIFLFLLIYLQKLWNYWRKTRLWKVYDQAWKTFPSTCIKMLVHIFCRKQIWRRGE